MPFLSDDWIWAGHIASATVAAVTYYFYRKNSRNIHYLQNAPVLPIDENLKDILSNSKGGTLPYVCISGDVYPVGNETLKGGLGDAEGVIHQKQILEHGSMRIQGFWSHKIRVIKNTIDSVAFKLKGQNAHVQICDPMESKMLPESFDIVSDDYHFPNQSFMAMALDRIAGDVSRGVQETERLLKVGTHLLGIGKLTLQNGVIQLEPPQDKPYILTKHTKTEVLRLMHRYQWISRLIFPLCSIVSICLIVLTLYRRYKISIERRNYEERVRELRRQQENDSQEGDHVIDPCSVCQTNRREVIMLNCGHVCVCVSCSEQLVNPKKCPICRTSVVRMLPVFL